jgi:hypothetical protein
LFFIGVGPGLMNFATGVLTATLVFAIHYEKILLIKVRYFKKASKI